MNIQKIKIKKNVSKRKNIQDLEKAILQIPGSFVGDSDNCPLRHSFADGCYVREIFLPKGTLVVGKIHKHSHPNFIMFGKVVVVTEEGKSIINGPRSLISPAGTKRVVLALEDTVWVTVHVTEKTNLEEIEEEIIAKDYTEIGLKDPYKDLLKQLKEEI